MPKIGAWADLQDQLQRRRAELGSNISDNAASTSKTVASSHALKHPLGASPNASGTAGRVAEHNVIASSTVANDKRLNGLASEHAKSGDGAVPVNGSGVVRRFRGGVRASAMGPLLNFLRSSGGLTDGHES